MSDDERLVYADWLDERGDAAQAEFQRWLVAAGVSVGHEDWQEAPRSFHIYGIYDSQFEKDYGGFRWCVALYEQRLGGNCYSSADVPEAILFCAWKLWRDFANVAPPPETSRQRRHTPRFWKNCFGTWMPPVLNRHGWPTE